MATWEQIATDLRDGITSGTYRAGATLPTESALAEHYGVSRPTVHRAIAQLVAEGLLSQARRRGTLVRRRPPRTRITRTRRVYRDELGYYFDPSAQTWRALRTPTVAWGPCPYDVAALLGMEPGAVVLTRDRLMGEADTGLVRQLATSYLPADLVRGTVLAEADTGPGGIYDRLEEMGHGPLRWSEAISARMPSQEEADLLNLAAGVPVLRIVRLAESADGTPVEVNDTRVDAELFEVGYRLTRTRW
jgi:GntR family transcriptional regulator